MFVAPASRPPPQNVRKGDLARSKVRGKRAIELGAGMGLAGGWLLDEGHRSTMGPCGRDGWGWAQAWGWQPGRGLRATSW